MTAVDPKRLVLIQAEFAAVDGVTRYEYSTGYYLKNDRILTAWHVFAGDALKSIKLRAEEGSGKERWCIAELVWHNGSLDAALLKATEAAPGFDELPPTSLSPIAENSDWESVGYPTAAVKRNEKKEREYKTSGLVGLLYAQGGGGQGRRELELGVSNGAKGDTWQGISGAPVFVGGKLVGMIMTCPRNFDGDRLSALPISLLFEDHGFLLALSPPWLEPFPQQDWCLILAADSDDTDEVEEILGAVLENNITGAAGKSIDKGATKVVKANEVLESPERWLQFVRALCVAPVLIADVTEFEPAIMLLLGIRAVVRRGVTITVTRSRFGDAEWKDLPFNIQEIKLIQLETDHDIFHPEHPVCLIGDAIRDGSVEVLNPDYLDLPVYDAVRCPEPRDKVGVSTLSDTALVLCSFHPEYAIHWRYVSDKLVRTRHTADYIPKKFSRMRDIASPRLVGKTLYEHIRWTSCCIVDWTHWRPNVLFELGARMACSDLHPICLIDKEDAKTAQQDSANGQRRRLLELLAPEEYVLGGPSDPFKKSFHSFSQRVLGESLETSHLTIVHGATYRVALEAYDWAGNWVIVSPHEEMCKTAEALLVVDQKEGGSQVLFSSNPEFSRKLMSNVRERWIAAWYYFLNRNGKEHFTDSKESMSELIDLGETTKQWLVRSKDPQHQRIYAEIGDLIEELESQ